MPIAADESQDDKIRSFITLTRVPKRHNMISSRRSAPAAWAGYPNITVPAGSVFGLPVHISFFGGAYAEPELLRLAYAFEQSSRHRKPPEFKPPLETSGWQCSSNGTAKHIA
jgi:Asp-tRNA(Asn)/Glu-tRNA(Gln) amidotransferase A subunit family amidase